MFKESVAQKPTMPVNAGKKKFQNEGPWSFDGCSSIGPNPFAALIAQNNNASAATGRNIALNTKSFLILSTPRKTINIFSNQKTKKQIIGTACGNKELLSISGIPGFHALTI